MSMKWVHCRQQLEHDSSLLNTSYNCSSNNNSLTIPTPNGTEKSSKDKNTETKSRSTHTSQQKTS